MSTYLTNKFKRPNIFKYFMLWSVISGIPLTIILAIISSTLAAVLSGTGDYQIFTHLSITIITIPLLIFSGLIHAHILNQILDDSHYFPIFNKKSTTPFSLTSLEYYRWRIPIIMFPISYAIVIFISGMSILLQLSKYTDIIFSFGLILSIPMSIIFVIVANRYLKILYLHDLEFIKNDNE